MARRGTMTQIIGYVFAAWCGAAAIVLIEALFIGAGRNRRR